MNLDDSFTDKLQKRRKARKDYLKVKLMGSSARRRSNTLIEEQQIPDEDNNEYQDFPKYPCVEKITFGHELEKEDCIEEVKENISFQQQEMEENNYIKQDKLTEEKVPLRARDLALLQKTHSAQGDLNERNMSRGTQQIDTPPTYLVSTKTRGLCSTRNRLARLAADINGWEDDLTRPAISSTPKTKKAPAAVFEEVEDTLNSSFEPSKLPLSERKAIFEQAAMAAGINGLGDNLTQPFVPTTSCTKKTPVAVAKKVDDILNCSFEPSNLPLSERKAIFEQAAMRNKVQSEKQTFKSKGSMGRRSAMFEKSPKNKFRFRTPHQKPTNTSPVNPSTNVGNTLKSVTALRPTKPSLLKGNPTRPSAASSRSPTNPSIASAGSPAFKCPAKPGATGRHTTSTPTKSFILKPPTRSGQQQCAKYTGTKPKIKQPLSSLVTHFEKLSSSTRCTSSQLEEVTKYVQLSRFK